MPGGDLDGYVTLAAAAAQVGVSRSALNKAVLSERLPSLRIGTGRHSVHLVRMEDVEAYIESRPGGRQRGITREDGTA